MKIVTIVGARPQFIKAAVVSRALSKHDNISELIVHTGQHYDTNMSDVFFDEMEIPKPAYTLGVGGSSHGAMTGRQLEKIEEVLLKENPDYVLVYGDTNSTLAGALAAVKLNIPVAHVEAGLRSFNMKMPEEINRILTDQVSNILFCPTNTAISNLIAEGFENKDSVKLNVGDVMYDAAMFYSKKAKKPSDLAELNLPQFILTTIHRAENTDSPQRLENIITALNELNEKTPVLCPIHPRTRKLINKLQLSVKFRLVDPVSYFEMIWLLQNCNLVVTDSGGLQKEAYFFGKSCITMRDQTEWVELIEAGVNTLVGADKDLIVKEALKAIGKAITTVDNLYGDANAGSKIAEFLETQ